MFICHCGERVYLISIGKIVHSPLLLKTEAKEAPLTYVGAISDLPQVTTCDHGKDNKPLHM
jgi:hypothetical protein